MRGNHYFLVISSFIYFCKNALGHGCRRGIQGPRGELTVAGHTKQTRLHCEDFREGKKNSPALIDMPDAGKLLAEPAVISPALHGGLNAALMPLTSPPLQQVLHLKVDHTG